MSTDDNISTCKIVDRDNRNRNDRRSGMRGIYDRLRSLNKHSM